MSNLPRKDVEDTAAKASKWTLPYRGTYKVKAELMKVLTLKPDDVNLDLVIPAIL